MFVHHHTYVGKVVLVCLLPAAATRNLFIKPLCVLLSRQAGSDFAGGEEELHHEEIKIRKGTDGSTTVFSYIAA